MDIRSYFSAASTSADKSSSSEDESVAEIEPSPPKKSRYRSKSKSSRKYCKKWEEEFSWLEYDNDHEGAFCKLCRRTGRSLERTGGIWVTKPFSNWKKAVEKMKAHEKSNTHSQAKVAALAAAETLREGSIIQQLQKVDKQERKKNKEAVKCLLRCTHFLVRNHIPHTTKFEKLVDLVVACGGEALNTSWKMQQGMLYTRLM